MIPAPQSSQILSCVPLIWTPQYFQTLSLVSLWLQHPCTPRDSLLNKHAFCSVAACLAKLESYDLGAVLQQNLSLLAKYSCKNRRVLRICTLGLFKESHLHWTCRHLASLLLVSLWSILPSRIQCHPRALQPLQSLHVSTVFCHSMTQASSVILETLGGPILLRVFTLPSNFPQISN